MSTAKMMQKNPFFAPKARIFIKKKKKTRLVIMVMMELLRLASVKTQTLLLIKPVQVFREL